MQLQAYLSCDCRMIMGTYINKGNSEFHCFGKSMAAKMLCAYYDKESKLH